MRAVRFVTPLGLVCALCACTGSVTRPSTGALVTVDVESEQFRIWLTDEDDIEAARRAHAGGSARIPNGRIVAGTQFNRGWSWHLEDVEFVEAAIEVCDGRPADVEREGTQYGGGRYCPWGAQVVDVETF